MWSEGKEDDTLIEEKPTSIPSNPQEVVLAEDKMQEEMISLDSLLIAFFIILIIILYTRIKAKRK